MSITNEQVYFYKGSEANLPTNGIKVGALYHCTDTKNTYIGTSETVLELWSSGTSYQQLDGGVVIGDGNAPALFSIAGGTSDREAINDIVGRDITGVSDTVIQETLGSRGVRLKNRLKDDTKIIPTADGEGGIAYGTGSHAITAMSVAIGGGVEAGSKGFYVHKITIPDDSSDITIQLSTKQAPYYEYKLLGITTIKANQTPVWSKTGVETTQLSSWSDGDSVNIILRKIFCLCGNITDIKAEDGIITISNTGILTQNDLKEVTQFDSLTESQAVMLSLIPYQFSINVPAKPEVGITDLHFCAFATGVGSIAAANLSEAHGKMNLAVGQYGFATGGNNIVGYGGFVSGEDNTVLGYDSHAEGYGNNVSGGYAHAEGSTNVVSGATAHAEGVYNTASGGSSHAEGNSTKALGINSHTEGSGTTAFGSNSHAEGNTHQKYNPETHGSDADTIYDNWNKSELTDKFALAFGIASHTEGVTNLALGRNSHAEGMFTSTKGEAAHSEGKLTKAENKYSHAEGISTTASGENSHAEGSSTTASGINAHAEGLGTIASGAQSHTEGNNTIASGTNAHAEGLSAIRYTGNLTNTTTVLDAWKNISDPEKRFSVAYGAGSHVEGKNNLALSVRSHAEGFCTIASGSYDTHAEGNKTQALGDASHSEGCSTKTEGNYSHAEGYSTQALGSASHAEGSGAVAQGSYSHAEGCSTTAVGQSSHTEGYSSSQCSAEITNSTTAQIVQSWTTNKFSLAKGQGTHVEGQNNLAIGSRNHAEGFQTQAIGSYDSHAEGNSTIASGSMSHAEGYYTQALGAGSHAGGYYTIASAQAQTAIGKYNKRNDSALFIVGNGTSDAEIDRKNAFMINTDGSAYLQGTLNSSNIIPHDNKTSSLGSDQKLWGRIYSNVLVCETAIRPKTNNSGYLGTAEYKWAGLQVNNFTVTTNNDTQATTASLNGNLNIPNHTATISSLVVNNATTLKGNVTINSNNTSTNKLTINTPIVLSSKAYGPILPTTGVKGQIFYLKA